MKEMTYNNGMSSRSRKPELIIFTPDRVWMGTNSIPGVAQVVETSYNKNGKWSSSTFQVILADGVDAVSVRQDFNTGKFFTDTCMSWAAVAKALKIEGVSPRAIEAAVREHWPKHAARFDERRNALIELEESDVNTRSITWEQGYHTRRIGSDVLLVDGELFKGETIPGKVVVLSSASNGQGGRYASTTYQLEVAEGTQLEYLTEGGFPGDDSLEERGWTFDGSTWQPPVNTSEPKEVEKNEGNIDLSALDGLFK